MKGKILLGLTAILMLTGAAVPVKADDVWKYRYRDGCSGAGHYG